MPTNKPNLDNQSLSKSLFPPHMILNCDKLITKSSHYKEVWWTGYQGKNEGGWIWIQA